MTELKVREHTMDVLFRQLSLNQVFFWEGHAYRKLPKNFAEKKTDDNQRVIDDGIEVFFSDEDVVIISKDDVNNLRYRT